MINRTNNYFALLSLAFLASLPVSAQTNPEPPAPPPPSVPAGVEVVKEIVIGQGGGRDLHVDIAYPKNSTPGAPLPAILLVHGGGWLGGKYSDELPTAYMLAEHGYFAACPEYRLSAEARWPSQIQDVKLAVRWVRANAARYNLNPDKIGCWGSSAGGHLVACLGTMDDPKFEGPGGYPGVSSRVAAVCDVSGPVDFTEGNFGLGSPTVSAGQRYSDAALLGKMLGATFAQNPALWKEASPITWVKAGNPPFLIISGDHDQIVATEQGIKFDAALKKAGVPTELVIVKNGDHIMRTPPGLAPASPNFVELMQTVRDFFDKYLKGANTPPS